MPIIETSLLSPTEVHRDNDQIYNGLDCCLTSEIYSHLASPQNLASPTYRFERALQGPILEMMLRGVRVNKAEAFRAAIDLNQKITRCKEILDLYAQEIWGRPVNAASPAQLKIFLYQAMNLPPQYKMDKGEKKLSVNRECLENLEDYFHARPVLNVILKIRDLTKQKEIFETEIDPDGRWRTSYNIGGTSTGRLSSSASSEDTGRNIQNVDNVLRHIFLADRGYWLAGIDLEQAESREVGWLIGILFDDWTYLNACYSGDLHTTVCKLTWTDLPWTGDLKKDKALAEEVFYRELSRRDMAKKLGHGSNYGGKPPTLAKHAKIDVKVAEDFQARYFAAFPGIPLLHTWVREQLRTKSSLTTVWGRTRHFFGRAEDDSTFREAVAFLGQSSTADRLNLILYKVWKNVPEAQLLIQLHDAIYFQFPETLDEDTVILKALKQFEIPLFHDTHEMVVGGDVKIGKNWGPYYDQEMIDKDRQKALAKNLPFSPHRLNLDGLKKWKPKS